MKKKIQHLFFLIVLIGIDQITKYFARAKFSDGDSFSIIPKALKLVYHENTGAVWGIMSDQTILLAIITLIALVVMLWIYYRIPNTKRYIPMQIILLFVGAGAIGNLIDRVVFGFVTDFIYFELIDFPVFNIADSYITVSVILLAILGIFYYKEEDFDCFSFKKKQQEETQQEETHQEETHQEETHQEETHQEETHQEETEKQV